MKTGAGITAILIGLNSLAYALYLNWLGSAAGWLGSFGPPGGALNDWAQMAQILSWLTPLLTLVGGIVTFGNPILGSFFLAASTFCFWYILGLSSVGQMFVLPTGATAVLAFLAGASAPSAAPIKRAATESSPAPASPSARYDAAKWKALLEYDKDVAAVADEVRPLGEHWLDELAASFLALNDKHYLPEILDKIRSRAEAERFERVERDVERDAARAQRDAEYRQRQAQLADARKARRAEWYRRLWGSPTGKRVMSSVVILAVVTGAVVTWRVNLPPPRPTDAILWSGSPSDCFEFTCLLAQMKKNGASADAVQFATKLARVNETPSWATVRKNFGTVDIVGYANVYERFGYFFVDRELNIVSANELHQNVVKSAWTGSTLSSTYPRAFAAGQEYIGHEEKDGGRSRFLFQDRMADCMACDGVAGVQYAYEFDSSGHFKGVAFDKVFPWSEARPYAEFDGPVEAAAAAPVAEAAVVPEHTGVAAKTPTPTPAASQSAELGDLKTRIRSLSGRLDALEAQDLKSLVGALEAAKAEPQRSAEARKLNDEGLATLKNGDVSSAIATLRKANLINPGDTEVAENLGYAELKNSDFASAEKHLIASIVLSPNRASSWASLGSTLASSGEVGDATVCFLMAFSVTRSQEASRRFFTGLASNDPNGKVRDASAAALRLFDSSRLFPVGDVPNTVELKN